ncbi:MAG: hypothetical protein H5T59_04235, partial [Anaerolineae bacterium]|nr:hypothetical protein [Anaerolineae bacterium]
MFATPEGQDRSPKPRRRWPRWDARTLLIPVWIALLLWAAGLAWWWTRLERAPAGPAPVAVRLATPTPRQAQEQAREEQPPIATPAVAPVAWTPGPAAARGDLWPM